LQGCGPKGSLRVKTKRKPESKPSGSPGVKPRGSPGVKAKGSPRVLESVKEYEGVNLHTPKATPTWGDGVPVDSRNFREQLQGSNLNGLWRSLYHWKVLGA